MKFLGPLNSILLFFLVMASYVFPFEHILRTLPKDLSMTDYVFIVDISQQKNYLFFKDTLIDQFDVSTGSKTRYKGNRELSEGIWRLGQRLEKDLKPLYGPRLIYLEKYRNDTKTFVKTNRAFHGTNEPENIGQPTSMGCVYHYNNDIINIYSFIPENTLVVSVKNI